MIQYIYRATSDKDPKEGEIVLPIIKRDERHIFQETPFALNQNKGKKLKPLAQSKWNLPNSVDI